MARASSQKPTFVVLAGPNGAGKSTFASAPILNWPNGHQGKTIEILDPDKIAASLPPSSGRSRDIQAMRVVHSSLTRAISSGISIGVETATLTNAHLRFAELALRHDYQFVLIYVYLVSVELHIARVSQRVARGGHHISEADIRRRYVSSVANLPAFASIAHQVSVIDNSQIGNPKVAAEKTALGWRIFAPLSKAPLSLRAAIEALATG